MMSKFLIEQPLVSVTWLFDHKSEEALIILDGSLKKVAPSASDASEDQIPQARFFDLKDAFSDTSAPFPTTFPSQEQFTREAQKLGIDSKSAIVVYDDQGIYSSARVWWLFKAMGHDNIAVLDGGLPEWKKAGYQTEPIRPYTGRQGSFIANRKPELMTFFNGMQIASKTKSHTIMDARSEARFKGLEPEPREGLRMGTIPNSINLPYKELLQGHLLISKEAITSKFQELANTDDALIFTCGSGITACILALAATISGYKNMAVYDGSWTEWGSLVKA